MVSAVVFGGTAEGRALCEVCAEHAVQMIYCAATVDGARPVEVLPNVDARAGRLDAAQMTALLEKNKPALVVDATHPYAEEVSANIGLACRNARVPLLRVTRERIAEQGCVTFGGMDALLVWLEKEPGNIFVTTGSSHAEAFSGLTDYRNRVWMRVLPSVESLRVCLDLGYRAERLICMQGPFSEALNRALFQAADARILVTKNSGAAGGFPEKVRAAQGLGMLTAVLAKPEETGGVSLEEACKRVMELRA